MRVGGGVVRVGGGVVREHFFSRVFPNFTHAKIVSQVMQSQSMMLCIVVLICLNMF